MVLPFLDLVVILLFLLLQVLHQSVFHLHRHRIRPSPVEGDLVAFLANLRFEGVGLHDSLFEALLHDALLFGLVPTEQVVDAS